MGRRIALLAAAAALVLAPPTVLAFGTGAKAPATRATVAPKAVVTPNGAWTTYHHDNSRAGYDPAAPAIGSVAPTASSLPATRAGRSERPTSTSKRRILPRALPTHVMELP